METELVRKNVIRLKGKYFKDPETINAYGTVSIVDIDMGDGIYHDLDLQESLKIGYHSPTGFNWGYLGSGPTQLALAVCLKFMPKDDAFYRKKTFKEEVIARLEFEKDFEIELTFEQIVGEDYLKKLRELMGV